MISWLQPDLAPQCLFQYSDFSDILPSREWL